MSLKKIRVSGILTWLPWCIYLTIGLFLAVNDFDFYNFRLFQYYRIVFNNLNFPEITNYLATVHPANADDIFLYRSPVVPGYVLLLTGLSKLVGLSVVKLKMIGVFASSLVYPCLVFVEKRLHRGTPIAGWILLLAVPYTTFSQTAENEFIFLYLFSPFIQSISDKSKRNKAYFSLCFIGTLFTWTIPILLFLEFFVRIIFGGRTEVLQAWNRRRMYIWGSIGVILVLTISLVHQQMAPSEAISFYEYVTMRSNDRLAHSSPLLPIKALIQTSWFLFRGMGVIGIFLFTLGVHSTSSKHEEYDVLKHVGYIILTYAFFIALFSKTVMIHKNTSFFFYTAMVLYSSIVIHRHLSWKRIKIPLFVFFFMAFFGIYQYGAEKFWVYKVSDLEVFIREMKMSDYLINNMPKSGPWPLNPNNPVNTLYIDASVSGNTLLSESAQGYITATQVSFNTVMYIDSLNKDIVQYKKHDFSKGANVFFITRSYSHFPDLGKPLFNDGRCKVYQLK